MGKHDSGADRSRRHFLKQVGGIAVGTIVLGACSDDNRAGLGAYASAASSLPSRYSFVPLIPGSSAPGLPGDFELSPLVMLNNSGMLLLYGVTGERYGLFAFEMDIEAGKPKLRGTARTILLTGTELADGRRVDSIDTVDINDHGSIALVLGTDGEINTDRLALMGPGVYLSRERTAFEPVVRFGDRLPDSDGSFGGVFGDLVLQQHDNLLLSAMYADRDRKRLTPADTVFSGLFHLPSSRMNGVRNVVSSTSLLRGTDRSISSFGLIDMAESGEYAAQVFASRPDEALDALLRNQPDTSAGSYVIGSSVTDARGTINLYGAGAVPNRPAGDVYFGPRVTTDGRRAMVENYADGQAVLYLDDTVVARTGSASPLGNTIRGLSAPVTGPDGLLFFLLTLESGFELCVTNSKETATILASGQPVGNRKIVTATLGYHSDQADSEARLAFYAEFDDGSNAVVVGVPS
ncbi:MAG TPA: hypothetical protein VET88_16115 [Gammaproteobacteria bacterium]|nr:hypothetical protein [Gammaproteobacteria bacterium]